MKQWKKTKKLKLVEKKMTNIIRKMAARLLSKIIMLMQMMQVRIAKKIRRLECKNPSLVRTSRKNSTKVETVGEMNKKKLIWV